MKNIIKKIKELSQDHTRLTVMFLIIALFLVIFVVYGIADSYFNYSTTESKKYYVYLSTEKKEFEAEVTHNRKGLINSFKPNIDINFESLPIYSNEEIVLPSSMLIVIYNSGNYNSYKTHNYSLVRGNQFITTGYDDKIEHYFLYDTKNLYFFKDDGLLTIDNEEINLSSGSYVVCLDDTVDYYDFKKDEYVSLKYNDKVVYESHYYYVTLSEDTISRTNDLLPKSLNYLKFLKK